MEVVSIFDMWFEPIEVYRPAGSKVKRNWGDFDTSEPSGSPAPFLVGYKKSHEIMGLVAPRATDETPKSPVTSKINEDAKSLFAELDCDLQSEDVIVYEDEFGKKQIYKVQGDTHQDYISPYTGAHGGKEVFVERYTKPRS